MLFCLESNDPTNGIELAKQLEPKAWLLRGGVAVGEGVEWVQEFGISTFVSHTLFSR